MYSANYPDIMLKNLETNPEIISNNIDTTIKFAFTKDDIYDYEEYEKLLDSAIREFRHSKMYTQYKSYLYSIGLDRCMFHPNIQADVASLEMHHCMLTIYDIAILITEHILNTVGYITEFDLSEYLRYEHSKNNIPIVFLCKTCHQIYHHKFLYVDPKQIFGTWWNLIEKYNLGINETISSKIIKYLNRSLDEKTYERNEYLLKLRDELYNWSTERGLIINEHIEDIQKE